MKWCNVMNMWCIDMDVEDYRAIGCDGDCRNCDECSNIKGNSLEKEDEDYE